MRRLNCLALLSVLALALGACGSEEGKALCVAIEALDLGAVETLIAAGADVNETVSFQGNLTKPMVLAMDKVWMDDAVRTAIAIAVIEGGGDPDTHDAFGTGNYLLPRIAEGGNAAVVRALVEAGANVKQDQIGGAALVWAARRNHVEILRILADAGARLNFKDDTGDSALGAAIEEGNAEAIAFLEERGASEW